MNLAALSLAALVVAIVVSCFSRLNVGVLAILMAWIVGVYFGGLKADEIAAGFPASLFLTLSGVTIFFAQAQANGTLTKLAQRAVGVCRGNAGWIAVMFFSIAVVLSTIGPGNIAAAALLAPLALPIAARSGISLFLMAILVGNGVNAGGLSPFAPTGIIVNGLMGRIGLPGLAWQTYSTNLAAHTLVAAAGFVLLGGLRLFRSSREASEGPSEPVPFDRGNRVTVLVLLALLASVVLFRVNVGMAAFTAAVVLSVLRAADLNAAVREAPWNVIVMVTGVTLLVALLERTGGLALLTDLLSRLATRDSVTALIAFVTGTISMYSSTSGVVIPAFLPTVPGLADRLGADPRSIAFSINIGAHLVDVSPLSTLGALCIAAAPAAEARVLFNKLMAWGVSMTVVGAAICYLFFGRG